MKLLALRKKRRRKVQRAFWALTFHKLIGPIELQGRVTWPRRHHGFDGKYLPSPVQTELGWLREGEEFVPRISSRRLPSFYKYVVLHWAMWKVNET